MSLTGGFVCLFLFLFSCLARLLCWLALLSSLESLCGILLFLDLFALVVFLLARLLITASLLVTASSAWRFVCEHRTHVSGNNCECLELALDSASLNT